MRDLTWEDVKEWKVKQYDCDGKLIHFDCDCINWLMNEVDQLRAEVERLEDENHALSCARDHLLRVLGEERKPKKINPKGR